MASHAFVDESKAQRYILAAATIDGRMLQDARRAMKDLLLPAQRRIHFRDESDSRKLRVIKSVLALDIDLHVYVADRKPSQVEARRRCLTSLVEDLATQGIRELVLELDQAMLQHDKRTLAAATRQFFPADELTYRWRRAFDDPMLWTADTTAWCWAAGGRWRRKIEARVSLTEL